MARNYPSHDAAILGFIQCYADDPDVFTGLTFRALGKAVGISGAAVHERLKLMRECGIVTYERGNASTLRVLNPDLTLLKNSKPIGKPPKSDDYCTARGCLNYRNGDQWCAGHEQLFRSYRGTPVEA
jgi:hypothetical protein